MNVGGRVVHGVSDAGLSSEMHDVSERDELDEFLEEGKNVELMSPSTTNTPLRSRPTTPSPRRFRAEETCVPTKPAAPVTRTERSRLEDRTRFSQRGPPQEELRREEEDEDKAH